MAIWSSTTEPPTYPTLTGCDSCIFPFVFADTTFDTCISIEGVDNQPWCPSDIDLPSPYDEGTHIFVNAKVSCSVSDPSCPSTQPKRIIASPYYPQNYPNNVDEVKYYEIFILNGEFIGFLDLDTCCS